MSELLDMFRRTGRSSERDTESHDWQQLLRPIIAGSAPSLAAPEGFRGPSIPNINGAVTSSPYEAGLPKFRGGIESPLFGGQVGLHGSYFKPDEYAQPNWSAMLNFRKQF